MKLATMKTNKRDGQLIVVNRALTKAVTVEKISCTLQQALEQWGEVVGPLQDIYEQLNDEVISNSFPIDFKSLHSPLPRAYQWADGSAYVHHVELVRKARGAKLPESFWHDPLMYQGGSDSFLGPRDDIVIEDLNWGVDFESEIAVISKDVPMGSVVDKCLDSIILVMLVNDVSLRNLIPAELAKGFGFFQSKPSSSFSPVAVTLDELNSAWDGYRLHLPVYSKINNQLIGSPNAGKDMIFDFPTLISHAAKTRALTAGSIIGSGTISNKDSNCGSSCLAEIRMLEKLNTGNITTDFLQYNDLVTIEMFDKNKKSIFGAISQKIVPKRF